VYAKRKSRILTLKALTEKEYNKWVLDVIKAIYIGERRI